MAGFGDRRQLRRPTALEVVVWVAVACFAVIAFGGVLGWAILALLAVMFLTGLRQP